MLRMALSIMIICTLIIFPSEVMNLIKPEELKWVRRQYYSKKVTLIFVEMARHAVCLLKRLSGLQKVGKSD